MTAANNTIALADIFGIEVLPIPKCSGILDIVWILDPCLWGPNNLVVSPTLNWGDTLYLDCKKVFKQIY